MPTLPSAHPVAAVRLRVTAQHAAWERPRMQGFFEGSLLDRGRRGSRECRELSESEVELEIVQPRNTWVHILRE